MFYETREKVINLFNDFSTNRSKDKFTSIHQKGRPSDLASYFKNYLSNKCFKDHQ